MQSFKERLKETTEKLKYLGTSADSLDRQIQPLVERATSDLLINPDWGLNMELVDIINSESTAECNEKVFKALKRRLTKNSPKVQLLTLTLLETCVKNAGINFQVSLATSDFWEEVVHMAEPKRRADLQVQDKVLILVEDCAKKLRPHEFQKAYADLQAAGVRFPVRPPEEIGAGFSSQVVAEEVPRVRTANMSEADQIAVRAALQELEEQERQRHDSRTSGNYISVPTNASPPNSYTPVSYHPPRAVPVNETEALRSDLKISKNSMELLKDALGSIPGNEPEFIKQDYIRDLAEQCKEIRKRMTRCIETVTEENLLDETLVTLEELNFILAKYDEKLAQATMRPDQQKSEEESYWQTADDNTSSLVSNRKQAQVVDPLDLLIDNSSFDYQGSNLHLPVSTGGTIPQLSQNTSRPMGNDQFMALAQQSAVRPVVAPTGTGQQAPAAATDIFDELVVQRYSANSPTNATSTTAQQNTALGAPPLQTQTQQKSSKDPFEDLISF